MTKITEADLDIFRTESEGLGLEFADTLEFYREWEMRVALRALRRLVPVVTSSGDADLERDFDVLVRVVGNHWKGAYAAQDRQIGSGRRSEDTLLEQQARDAFIQAEAARLTTEKGTARGVAGVIKRKHKLDLSERQIRAIIKKAEITS